MRFFLPHVHNIQRIVRQVLDTHIPEDKVSSSYPTHTHTHIRHIAVETNKLQPKRRLTT